jgi:hypothetical protein
MDYLGMLCLGGFVGGIVTYGLHLIERFDTFARAVTTILAAALSGSVILFIDKFNTGKALGAYCVGLLVALMWAFGNVALRNVQSKNPSLRILGWAHIVGVVVVTLVVAALFLPSAFREMGTQY